jgi:hypothetical protein
LENKTREDFVRGAINKKRVKGFICRGPTLVYMGQICLFWDPGVNTGFPGGGGELHLGRIINL